jgi:endonuclease/exonuclease/phosphatase family metal-dependent hydrolase
VGEKQEIMQRLRVATYNIHKARGLDRRVRAARIVEVLQQIQADVVALQEVLSMEGARPEDHQARFIAYGLGFHYRIGENRRLNGGVYGNVTMSRFPVLYAHNYDISRPGREERGCLRTDVAIASGNVVSVYNVHLGTSYRERREQAHRLFESALLHPGHRGPPKVILGDFNEWFSGLASSMLKGKYKSAPVRKFFGKSRTYPGIFPLVHLDHVYFEGDLDVVKVGVHRSRKALVASDHLPIVVDFELT